MPFTLTMPKLSPTMEQGTIAHWHKSEGEHVADDALLIEVATDKAVVEYRVLDGGWLRKILIHEGEEASVNQAIAIFTTHQDESIENYKPEGLLPEKPTAPLTAAIVQEKEGVVARPAAASPTPRFTPEPPLESYRFEFSSEAIDQRLKASPLARYLAKERGLDLTTVKGSGPDGRIVERDLAYAQPIAQIPLSHRELPTKAPGSYTEEALTPMRKIIGQRLQDAKSSIPHFYLSLEVNAESLIAQREQLAQVGIKITVNDFIIRACALALRKHPSINSGFDSTTHSIIRFETIDIAIAVSLPSGLITPILRHADYKKIGEISAEMRYLAKKAKENKLQPHEYKGGSITISNLGMFGISHFQAILNPPQAAILAVAGILDTPVVRGGAVVAGKIMTLTLSVDHRVIDGVAAAQFLNEVKKFLEQPAALLI